MRLTLRLMAFSSLIMFLGSPQVSYRVRRAQSLKFAASRPDIYARALVLNKSASLAVRRRFASGADGPSGGTVIVLLYILSTHLTIIMMSK